MNSPHRILASHQSHSDAFTGPGGIVSVFLADFVEGGEDWRLQFEDPDNSGTWINLSTPRWDEDDAFPFYAAYGVRYRLSGGSSGARAWIAASRVVVPGAIGDS